MLHQATVGPQGPARGAVVLLHGFGADELDLLGLAAALPPDLLYVALRAPLRLPWGGYAWYPLRALPGGADAPPPGTEHAGPGAADEGLDAAVRAVASAIAAAAARLELEPRRTVLAGFSQGAAVAAAVMGLPEAPPLAAYAMLSGFLPGGPDAPAAPRAGVPAFVAHGSQDPLLPVGLGRCLRDRLAARGSEVTYREYEMAHAITDQELADLARWLAAVLGPAAPAP